MAAASMGIGRLSSLQHRILGLLAHGVRSPWVLTGGAALGGFYTRHRTTRDLDLTPGDRQRLGSLPAEVEECLIVAGLAVRVEKLDRDRVRLYVSDGADSVLVELVGGWSARSEPPTVAADRRNPDRSRLAA
jgi:hypothetical protein